MILISDGLRGLLQPKYDVVSLLFGKVVSAASRDIQLYHSFELESS